MTTPTAGWAADARGAWLLRTEDGGRSWNEVAFNEQGAEPLMDAQRLPSGDWLAVGAFGRVLRSRDGGHQWHAERIEGQEDWHLNGIAGSADGRHWLILLCSRVALMNTQEKGIHILNGALLK